MPKVNRVEKARVDQGTCKCGKEIKAGDAYKWIKFRFGGRRIRCGSCDFKASDLTQSEFLGQVYDLNDRIAAITDSMGLEEIQAEAEDIATEFENLASECEDKLGNMPEGFQQGSVGEMLQSRSDACNDVAGNLQGVDFDFDEEGATDDAKEELDGEDVHTKELTDEVKARLREESKENAERDKGQVNAMDEESWYTELTESYVDQGIDEDEFEEKVAEKLEEKRQEKVTEIVEEITSMSYEGE